ncbi:MAG: uridine kinase [Bacteroidota bacterium]
MQQSTIIGITGGSGSGKTYFLNSLLDKIDPEQVCLISQDNYYRARNSQPVDENGVKNFDTPGGIDHEAFADDVRKLKNGQEVERLEYTFNNPDAEPKMLVFKPAPIIVVEGIFVFYFKAVSELLDLRVFIEAQNFLMLKRRIIRDAKERGYDLDDVLYRYEKHVAPTYQKYIEPYKHSADLIIPNNFDFKNALGVLVAFCNETISQHS